MNLDARILADLRRTYLSAIWEMALFPEGSREHQRGEDLAASTSYTVFSIYGMEFLRSCLAKLREATERLGRKLNEKKTKIVRLTRPFTFLKMRFLLTKTGAVVRRLGKKSAVSMRRKLKRFHKWYLAGKMLLEAIRRSYTSWRGHAGRARSHNIIETMDELFMNLFGRESLCLLS